MVDVLRDASLNEWKYRAISANGRALGVELFRKEVMCGYMSEVLSMLEECVVRDGIKESIEYSGIEFVRRYRYPLMKSDTKCECSSCKELKWFVCLECHSVVVLKGCCHR